MSWNKRIARDARLSLRKYLHLTWGVLLHLFFKELLSYNSGELHISVFFPCWEFVYIVSHRCCLGLVAWPT